MKSIIILASLLLVATSKRIRVKQSYTYNNSNEDNKLKFSAQQKIITMLNVSDVYDVDILQMENGAVKQVVETPYISLDNEYLDEYKIDNECVGLPKHPKLFEVFEHDILEQTEDIYYTDILALPQLDLVFLVTDNLLLMQGTLSKNGSEWSFSMKNNSVQLKKNFTSYANAQFCCYEQRCLIITNLGGFQINITSDMDKNETIFIEEPQIAKRPEFYTLSNFESDLAVAVGTQGVDIYSFDQDSFKQTFSLTVSDFKTKQINIISLKLSRGRLSALDEYNGLFIFDFKKNHKPTLLMFVPIPRCVAFDHYQDTYLVVAQTPNNIEYMMELFVNLSNDDYYINRVYVDDFSFKDIEINEHYAIVIGEDVHMVIRHSIFNGFLKNNKELIKTFFQNELIRFEHYDLPKESADNHKFNEISYYVGLSKGSIHIWRLLEYNAVVICQFQNGESNDYIVRSNSTSCPNRTINEVYEQCTTTQKLNIQVSGSLIESDQLSLIIGLSVAGGVILLGIILFLCKKGRGMLKRVQELRKQAQEMKKYGHFQEVEQISIDKQ